jgi:DNA-binding MarR family transcriptional regulator
LPASLTHDAHAADQALEQFANAWERFVRAARRAQGRANQATSSALSHAQYLLVEVLLDEPSMTVSRLAAAAGVAQPTATRMLAGLQREGGLRRLEGQIDRRVVALELTPVGRELVAAKRGEVMANRQRIFASIPPAQRAEAAELLDLLTDAMKQL